MYVQTFCSGDDVAAAAAAAAATAAAAVDAVDAGPDTSPFIIFGSCAWCVCVAGLIVLGLSAMMPWCEKMDPPPGVVTDVPDVAEALLAAADRSTLGGCSRPWCWDRDGYVRACGTPTDVGARPRAWCVLVPGRLMRRCSSSVRPDAPSAFADDEDAPSYSMPDMTESPSIMLELPSNPLSSMLVFPILLRLPNAPELDRRPAHPPAPLLCRAKASPRANLRSQCGQMCGFSPVCSLLCRFRSCRRRKRISQPWQIYGFSWLCVNRWLFRL